MLTLKDDVSVPICLSGALQETQIDFCMDGVPYLLVSQIGTYRIKPRNDEVDRILRDAVHTRTIVGVCGYLRRGVECFHLDTYWAGHPEELVNMTSARVSA